jgi:hypothetical protein
MIFITLFSFSSQIIARIAFGLRRLIQQKTKSTPDVSKGAVKHGSTLIFNSFTLTQCSRRRLWQSPGNPLAFPFCVRLGSGDPGTVAARFHRYAPLFSRRFPSILRHSLYLILAQFLKNARGK